MPSRGALATALARLEERFGDGAVLSAVEAAERQSARRISLGVASVDELLDGGIAAGEPLALLGAPSSGAATLALTAARAAQSSGGEVAWLDPARSFDALAASRCGVDLERLLLLRADGDDIPFVATTVARSAAFVLLVIDLAFSRASVDALAPVVPQTRAAGVATLIVAANPGRRLALPSLEVRRVGWLRRAGRTIGWCAIAARRHRSDVARLSFAPLALPPSLVVDEGLRTIAEAVG